jgi:hypothetical protein
MKAKSAAGSCRRNGSRQICSGACVRPLPTNLAATHDLDRPCSASGGGDRECFLIPTTVIGCASCRESRRVSHNSRIFRCWALGHSRHRASPTRRAQGRVDACGSDDRSVHGQNDGRRQSARRPTCHHHYARRRAHRALSGSPQRSRPQPIAKSCSARLSLREICAFVVF